MKRQIAVFLDYFRTKQRALSAVKAREFVITKLKNLTVRQIVTVSAVAFFSAVAATAILYVGIRAGTYLDFHPLNGAWQTFNPTRRIADGEFPLKDFTVYLGLLPSWIMYVIHSILGGDLSASQAAIHATIFGLGILWAVALPQLAGGGRALGLSLGAATIIVFFSLAMGAYEDNPKILYYMDFVIPASSNLGLRACLPLITALLTLSALKARKSRQIYYLGALAGLQPLWSPDYGLPSAILYPLFLSLIIGWKPKQLASIALVSGITFVVVLTILTGGSPFSWFSYQLAVSGAQYVTFASSGQHVIHSIADIPVDQLKVPTLALGGVVMVLGVLQRNARLILLAYIGITALAAGYLTSIGGFYAERYFVFSRIVTPFLLLAIIVVAFKGHRPWNRSYILYAVPAAMTYFAASSLDEQIEPNMPSTEGYLYVEELGGYLSPHWEHTVQIGRSLNGGAKPVWSTYSSIIDELSESISPANSDYIIHALGSELEEDYLNDFLESSPDVTVTIRESFVGWAAWNVRSFWPWYRVLIRDYEVVDATFYAAIWKRRDVLRAWNWSAPGKLVRYLI